jgi:hypothetical protein
MSGRSSAQVFAKGSALAATAAFTESDSVMTERIPLEALEFSKSAAGHGRRRHVARKFAAICACHRARTIAGNFVEGLRPGTAL